jgi:hypothetical protein
MTIAEFLDWIIRLATLFGLAVWIYHVSQRVAKSFRTVMVIWKFLMERATMEAHDHGWLTENQQIDPCAITREQRMAFKPLMPELKKLFNEKLHSIADEDERRLIIQEVLGKRLADEVCLKIGSRMGSCLAMADYFAREGVGSC